MKKKILLHAMASVMAFAISGQAAQAIPIAFNHTGGWVNWQVPTDGLYQIIAYGAQGGGANNSSYSGGKGAKIGGDFTLAANEQLAIAVGGQGGSRSNGGGGGGGFVIGPGNSILAIAGGGGGAGAAAGAAKLAPMAAAAPTISA